MKHGLFLFLLIASTAYGQNDSLLEACRLRDTIWFTENLVPVFDKMHRSKSGAEKNVTKIVQIGDSHVQMGYFSNAVGEQLNALYGDVVTNSFWFPYATVNGYNPRGVRFTWEGPWKGEKMVGSQSERRFGISGHAFVLTEKGLQQPFFTVELDAELKKLEILIETNSSWRFCVDSAKVKTKKISEHLSLVTIEREHMSHRLKISMCPVGKEQEQLRILGFRNATHPMTNGVDFQFYGSSGGKYSDYVGGAAYFYENLAWLQPDLLIISLGTNDTYVPGLTNEGYHTMVNGFITSLRMQHPNMQILLTMPPDTYFKEAKPASAEVVFQSLFRVAQEQHCALWNFAEVMGGSNSIQLWFTAGLSNADLMHFNPKGYQLQGQLLVEALNKAYRKYYN